MKESGAAFEMGDAGKLPGSTQRVKRGYVPLGSGSTPRGARYEPKCRVARPRNQAGGGGRLPCRRVRRRNCDWGDAGGGSGLDVRPGSGTGDPGQAAPPAGGCAGVRRGRVRRPAEEGAEGAAASHRVRLSPWAKRGVTLSVAKGPISAVSPPGSSETRPRRLRANQPRRVTQPPRGPTSPTASPTRRPGDYREEASGIASLRSR